MKETVYWLPHSTLFFSWLWAVNSQFKCVPCSDTRQLSGKISIPMHSVHTLSAQQHASVHGLGQGLNRVLLIFLFTKRQRKRDKMTGIREKNPLKKVDTHLLKLFIIMYTPNPSCSGVYLSQVHGTRSSY